VIDCYEKEKLLMALRRFRIFSSPQMTRAFEKQRRRAGASVRILN